MTTTKYFCPKGCGHLEVREDFDLSGNDDVHLDVRGDVEVSTSFWTSEPPCDHLRDLLDELKRSRQAMAESVVQSLRDGL